MPILIGAALACLLAAVGVLTLYAARHYLFALTRLTTAGSRDMMELAGFLMPHVSVLVPMHNEEEVAADVLQALVDCDYDWSRLEILAINDRSTDRTAEIIDRFAAQYPIIKAVHRLEGDGGKPAGLAYAAPRAAGEILLLFDADYVPGRAMLKMLVTPFCDPEIGAVMGRVVPHNAGESLLAGLLSLERAAGYQIGQQARYQLGLTSQFGGTVGGVRASALRAVGGWNINSLTEDTDLTCSLLTRGWKVAYVNRAECYEEVPQTWPVRRRQLMRWVTGHTECLHRFWPDIVLSRALNTAEKLDALFMLACYWTAPVMLVGWLASLALLFSPAAQILPVFWLAFYFAGYQLFANQATFFEIGAAALLDGSRNRVLLLPLNLFNFFASTGAITSAMIRYYLGGFWRPGKHHWHKTTRYRANGNGLTRTGTNGPALLRGADGLYFGSQEGLGP